MKAALKLAFCLPVFSISSYAETEQFDMALTGQVSKDYCVLAFVNGFNNATIDLSDPNTLLGANFPDGNTYYMVASQRMKLLCSPGAYNYSFATNHSNYSIPHPTENYILATGGFVENRNGNYGNALDQSNPMLWSWTVGNDPVYDSFDLVGQVGIRPKNGVLNDLPSSFSYPITFVVTIEAQK